MNKKINNSQVWGRKGLQVKKLLALVLVLSFATIAIAADTNSGKITKKGDIGVVLDYATGQTTQKIVGTGGIANPWVAEVTQLGVVYGLMDKLEVGLTRIDDKVVALAVPADRLYSNNGLILTGGYDITDMLGNFAYGCDVKAVGAYALARANSISQAGQSVDNQVMWNSNSLYMGVKASKAMLLKGMTVGGSLGVLNSWDVNTNEDNNATFINQKGKSAFAISLGADYVVMADTVAYLTISHVDKSNQVGVQQDGGQATPRDDGVDSIILGVRYDI
ncbi:hypothetical protein ACFL5G_00755 [Candidatus Margulisiibacteriota bacterium]